MYNKVNRNSLGQFLKSREKMLHISKPLLDHPEYKKAQELGEENSYHGPRWILGLGNTYRKPS